MARLYQALGGRFVARITPFVLGFLIAGGLPTVGNAQVAAGAQAEELQQLISELRQLSEKLESIRNRAMEDHQLQQAEETLGADIKAAMEKADPELVRGLDRFASLEADAAAAQQANDAAKLQQLAQEAEAIQMRFVQVRAEVLARPEISQRIEAFQDRLESRMLEIDAETPNLIQRFNELENRLETALMQN